MKLTYMGETVLNVLIYDQTDEGTYVLIETCCELCYDEIRYLVIESE